MAIGGFKSPVGAQETMIANISTTKRYPMERADNAQRPPQTREPWDEPDDEPAPPPPPPPSAPVTISKAPSALRRDLEAQLARKRAQGPGPAPAPGNPAVSHAPSPMRMALEAELARRQGGVAPPAVRRPMMPRIIQGSGGGGQYDPPEGVGAGSVPPGGMKVR